LLTADIQQEGEQCLLTEGIELESTVLKVAHHGAETSSSLPFLNAVSPRLAIISVGAGNRSGYPDPETMSRLTESLGRDNLYLTAERGSIELITDGHRLWLNTEH
jgi:competence protein ComEC